MSLLTPCLKKLSEHWQHLFPGGGGEGWLNEMMWCTKTIMMMVSLVFTFYYHNTIVILIQLLP